MSRDCFVGLISGTSVDGVDAVVVRFESGGVETYASGTTAYSGELKSRIERLIAGTSCTPHEWATLDQTIGAHFAEAALRVIEESKIARTRLAAIGSHGQTVFHLPPTDERMGTSVQLGDSNVIAARTGVPTVGDFRRLDMALGGEGAPLVPPFHRWLLGASPGPAAVLNLGGISNLTLIDGDRLAGFDCGPANTLLDRWTQRHRNQCFDEGGAWARTGTIVAPLLEHWLSDPYFAKAPPKSTGREYFNEQWLGATVEEYAPADVARTLVELSAQSIAAALTQALAGCRRVIAAGGGVRNVFLMERLETLLPCPLGTSNELGVDPGLMEATAFAWLARERIAERVGSAASVTGARADATLGGLYCPPKT